MPKYHLEKKKNRLNSRKDGLWHATPVPRPKLETQDLCRRAAGNTTLSPIEVQAVLDLLGRFVPHYLAQGYAIRLGNLGAFSLTFSSEGVEQPEDFHPRLMRPARVIFQPSRQLTQAVRRELSYEAGGVVDGGIHFGTVADWRRHVTRLSEGED